MATFNETTRYIELSDEDREAMRGDRGNWAENIINWIINNE